VKVFNLTDKHVDYRGRTMPGYGMSEHADLKHVPDRDLALQDAGILAFGSLPKGWSKPEPVPEPTPDELAMKEVPAKKASDVVKLEETVKVEVKIPAEARPESKDDSKKKK